jgi:hypothetical protein
VPKRGAKTLPPEVERQLAETNERLRFFLAEVSAGAVETEVTTSIDGVLNGPLYAARAAGDSKRRKFANRDVDFSIVIATKIRTLRLGKGLTQAQLAGEMQARGFDWKRITVAEIEAGADRELDDARKAPRKVSLEELLVLAMYFEKPMVELLLPDEHEWMAKLGMTGAMVRQHVLGTKEGK